MKRGRPRIDAKLRKSKTVSFRITPTAEKAVKRLMQSDNLNSAMNQLLENIESNIVFINDNEQQILNDGLGIEDAIAYYSAIILNDLEEARENIQEQSNQAIEEYIDVGFERINHHEEW